MEIRSLICLMKAALEEDNAIAKEQLKDVYEEYDIPKSEKVLVYWAFYNLEVHDAEELAHRLLTRYFNITRCNTGVQAKYFVAGILAPSNATVTSVAGIGWDGYVRSLYLNDAINREQMEQALKDGPPKDYPYPIRNPNV